MKTSDEIEFFLLKFVYTKDVLTPRFETESLVREAIKIINENWIKTLIDVWTWSWIIPISIEKNTELESIYWFELSKNAIKIAEINKKVHNSKIQIFRSDLLSILKNENLIFWNNEQLLITANLPYIKDEDWQNMSEDTIFEPKMALFWWKKTGFELYEKFFKQVISYKNTFLPWKIFLICEFGFDQEDLAREFFSKRKIDFRIFPDFRWINRFISLELI